MFPNLVAAQIIISVAQWPLVGEWPGNSRYLSGKNQTEVTNFAISIKEVSGWIKTTL